MTTEVGECHSCHAPVFWLKHERTQKRAPIDATASVHGNIAIDLVVGDYRMIHPSRQHEYALLHTSHFVTCPNAAQHRPKKE